MAKPHLRDADRERFWRSALRDWRAGGDGVREFCRRRGLLEASFYYWRRELLRRDAEAKPAFVPVHIEPPAACPVEVRCPSGHVVVFGSADASTLKGLFAALHAHASEGRSC